jgi:transcriptional regulator with XRE-family HTH domain
MRELRVKRGMSQIQLSERLNTSQQQVSRYESGEREPIAEMIVKLADVLQTSTDYLLGRTENSHELKDVDLSESERRVIAAMRHSDSNVDVDVLADDIAKLPDPIRNEIWRIIRGLQE